MEKIDELVRRADSVAETLANNLNHTYYDDISHKLVWLRSGLERLRADEEGYADKLSEFNQSSGLDSCDTASLNLEAMLQKRNLGYTELMFSITLSDIERKLSLPTPSHK